VLPAIYTGNWMPSAAAIGQQGAHESLLYVVAPGIAFPASATNSPLLVQHVQTVTLTNWPAGKFIAEWYDPATAAPLGWTQTITTNGGLALTMPDFTEDLAAIVYPPPQLASAGFASTNGFQFKLVSETGGHYLIQKSFDLVNWSPLLALTNVTGTMFLSDPSGGISPQSFYRALKAN